jgi:dipeptidyl aminopeptidase/acylaminoacyl peptidase
LGARWVRRSVGSAQLEERSPLHDVDGIKKPLRIGQGANDTRVKHSEADQFIGAMEKKGIPLRYVLYPDEGHGFSRAANRTSFYALSEAFLSKCLRGRFEPVGDDFKGSSISAPKGADNLPGLFKDLKDRG